MNEYKVGQSLTPEEVFEIIRQADYTEHWESAWKAKGYKNWEEWRRDHFKNILSLDLPWTYVEIREPLKEVPEWHGTLTPSWHKYFYGIFGGKPPKLKDLITHPGIANHWYIREMAKDFKDSVVVILKNKNGEIFLLDGMHRCNAIALIARDKGNFNAKLFAAMVEWPEIDPPRLGMWDK